MRHVPLFRGLADCICRNHIIIISFRCDDADDHGWVSLIRGNVIATSYMYTCKLPHHYFMVRHFTRKWNVRLNDFRNNVLFKTYRERT